MIISGTYGSNKTPCKVVICEHDSGTWYCVEGSVNVNLTGDILAEPLNVETVEDIDFFTAGQPINTEEELLEAIES